MVGHKAGLCSRLVPLSFQFTYHFSTTDEGYIPPHIATVAVVERSCYPFSGEHSDAGNRKAKHELVLGHNRVAGICSAADEYYKNL
jgi:hypothetical protein